MSALERFTKPTKSGLIEGLKRLIGIRTSDTESIQHLAERVSVRLSLLLGEHGYTQEGIENIQATKDDNNNETIFTQSPYFQTIISAVFRYQDRLYKAKLSEYHKGSKGSWGMIIADQIDWSKTTLGIQRYLHIRQDFICSVNGMILEKRRRPFASLNFSKLVDYNEQTFENGSHLEMSSDEQSLFLKELSVAEPDEEETRKSFIEWGSSYKKRYPKGSYRIYMNEIFQDITKI